MAATQQHNHGLALADVVEPIARPSVDSQLRDPITHRSCVSEVSHLLDPVKPDIDARYRLAVSKATKPTAEGLGLPYYQHAHIVPHTVQYAKGFWGCGEEKIDAATWLPGSDQKNFGGGRVLYQGGHYEGSQPCGSIPLPSAVSFSIHNAQPPLTTTGIFDMLDQAPYGAYAVDMSQTITFWNRGAQGILGHRADLVVGRKCYEVLQNLPDEGSNPVCMEGCPSIRLARSGRIPPIVHVSARCASGRRKRITMTPLIVSYAYGDPSMLLHLFHDDTPDARARRVASTVQGVLAARQDAVPATELTTNGSLPQASPLTARELQVLRLLALGLETKEIAAELFVSTNTIRNHVSNARDKMRAKSKLSTVLAAQRLGLL